MLFAGRVLRECRAERSPEAVSLICTPLHTMTKDRRRRAKLHIGERKRLSLSRWRTPQIKTPAGWCVRARCCGGGESQAREMAQLITPHAAPPPPTAQFYPRSLRATKTKRSLSSPCSKCAVFPFGLNHKFESRRITLTNFDAFKLRETLFEMAFCLPNNASFNQNHD